MFQVSQIKLALFMKNMIITILEPNHIIGFFTWLNLDLIDSVGFLQSLLFPHKLPKDWERFTPIFRHALKCHSNVLKCFMLLSGFRFHAIARLLHGGCNNRFFQGCFFKLKGLHLASKANT